MARKPSKSTLGERSLNKVPLYNRAKKITRLSVGLRLALLT